MSMDRKNLLGLLSIALAIVVPLGIALQSQSDLSSNPIVKFKMTGYDPRDLLHGHYLMFRYEWNWANESSSQDSNACYGDDCCLCAEAKDTDPEVKLMTCDAAKKDATCAHIIRGQAWSNTDFAGPPTQYFVDENQALPLEKFFREQLGKTDFHMGLSLPRSGKARIEQLYIDGQPYQDYMTAHPEKFVLKDDNSEAAAPEESQPVPAE